MDASPLPRPKPRPPEPLPPRTPGGSLRNLEHENADGRFNMPPPSHPIYRRMFDKHRHTQLLKFNNNVKGRVKGKVKVVKYKLNRNVQLAQLKVRC